MDLVEGKVLIGKPHDFNGKITLVSGVDFPLNQSIEILYSSWMFIANHIGEIQNPPFLWGTEMGRKVLEVQVCYETIQLLQEPNFDHLWGQPQNVNYG